MHVCAEPKRSVMLQAYSLNAALPKQLVCCRRWAAESGSPPVPLSPGSVVLTQLFYLVLKPLDSASPSAWLCFSLFILLVLEMKAGLFSCRESVPCKKPFCSPFVDGGQHTWRVLLFSLSLFLPQLLRGVSSSTPARPFLVPETTQSPVLPAGDMPLGQHLEDPTRVCVSWSLPLVISPFA